MGSGVKWRGLVVAAVLMAGVVGAVMERSGVAAAEERLLVAAGNDDHNLVRNGTFEVLALGEAGGELGGKPAGELVPGWSVRYGHVNSLVRVTDVFNTDTGDKELEIAARDGDRVVVTQRISLTDLADVPLFFGATARALSTQGDFRVALHLYDRNNVLIGTVGWAAAGEVPKSDSQSKWFDQRFGANYLGKELRLSLNLPLAASMFFRADPGKIASADIEIVVANGQHGIFDDIYIGSEKPQAASDERELQVDTPYYYVAPMPSTESMPLQPEGSGAGAAVQLETLEIRAEAEQTGLRVGDSTRILTTVRNTGSQALTDIEVTAAEPYGYGLIIAAAPSPYRTGPLTAFISSLTPGEAVELAWEVTAQRPDSINLGRPWEAKFSVAGGQAPSAASAASAASVALTVEDPAPGAIYYVLTEDLEPMDSAGYGVTTGNRNAWLDPEEYRVQLVAKPEAMNRIAEKYGAKWTHFLAVPALVGARWAAQSSPTGAWQEVLAAIEASIEREAAAGHQYSPHIHIDYDYRIPGQVISYDRTTDGFWANHNEHGWAHQTPRLGSFADVGSRTGSLFSALCTLEELTRHSGQGQHVAVRTGSYDFGDGPEDERMSVEAFRRVGLWASSDADGNMRSAAAGDFAEALYFTRPDDINQEATSLAELGIVQFQVTPRQAILYDAESSTTLNAKVDAGVATFRDSAAASSGGIKPGVHAIVGFTHAMFMLGEGGWASTIGGDFRNLDAHLRYVKETYVDRGLVTFATANELIKAYLDYYTPVLLAVYEGEGEVQPGVYEYPLRLLGRTIPIDERHHHTVTVKYPLYLRESAVKVEILRYGEVIRTVTELPTLYNDIDFVVDRAGQYTMRVYVQDRESEVEER